MKDFNMKTFTVADFADAVEKNGLKQIKNWFFGDQDNGLTTNLAEYIVDAEITEACAVGQGAINLGINTHGWKAKEIFEVGLDHPFLATFLDSIVRYNDSFANPTFKQVAEYIRETFSDKLDFEFQAPEFDYSTVKFPEGFHAGS